MVFIHSLHHVLFNKAPGELVEVQVLPVVDDVSCNSDEHNHRRDDGDDVDDDVPDNRAITNDHATEPLSINNALHAESM